ncbi:hypothetical protein [Paenibacillus tundrae]|uniref:Permuted papain-like amidase enzyme, YaeF/YiiX, C92 family n=1 Tax=Paenibacillus tundrae TaxID=528187 RepID=A0ABT9WEW6_9BACL|nr:hypothetical protein [Paenibacillus tundrae]MDQ0171819.1 hypothetical protein [Paenibacillus tundrae]
MKRLLGVTLALLLSITLIVSAFPMNASAASVNYPGTNFPVTPGDVLYSSKGWDTGFVGHVAIVGDDKKIYHSTPANDVPSGATGESLSSYLSRFPASSQIKVYNYFPDGQMGPFLEPVKAGKWARLNYSKVQKYTIASGYKMNDITKNYCSKFLWQAYKLGANVSIDRPYMGHYMKPDALTFFAPAEINFSMFSHVATIRK